MTGPNPDAELDAALGVAELPPAAVTDAHRVLAETALRPFGPQTRMSHESIEQTGRVAQAIADAEQRGAARVIAEHEAAGT